MATIKGNNSNNHIDGADGVTDGSDTIVGYGGNDTIKGGGGADHIYGDDGNSYANVSEEGDDKLYGGNGNDWLYGEGGDDTLYGNDDHDILIGGAGADKLDGGSDVDNVDYWESPEGVTVNLMTGKGTGGHAEGDQFFGIENIAGSNHDDVLVGHDGGNQLYGQGGDDVVKGYGGNDGIFGHAGDDTLLGMDGDDGLSGNEGNDTLVGGAGRDNMWGHGDADTFVWTKTTEAPFAYDPAWNEQNFGIDPNSIDVINDFNAAEGDLIDLSKIDADVLADGNQAFSFIGSALFSGKPDQVRYYQVAACPNATFIEINTDTDTEAEAMIMLPGTHTPEVDWFVL